MIDITKKYKTRDGREVRIYAVDGSFDRPIHGAIKERLDGWEYHAWTINGTKGGNVPLDSDLIEVKPRIQREVWVNVYSDEWMGVFPNKKVADETYTRNRIACVKLTIDCEEGEGL